MRPLWIVHVLLAIVGVLPAVAAGHVPGDGVDSFGTDWFYWWIRTCIVHGGDPSHTTLFFWPEGKDIFQHTGNNFVDAVFAAPLQLVAPVLGFSVFYVVVQLGNAVAFRPLARHLFEPREADFATLLWQVNPYVIFELGAGRPTQAMMWFVPPAVLYYLRGQWLWLGIAVAMTGWTYWFNGYFLVFLLLMLPFRPRTFLPASLVTLVLILPALVPMLRAEEILGVGSDGPLANNVFPDLHGVWLMETQGGALVTQPAWLVPILFARARRWWIALGLLVLIGLGEKVEGVRNPLHPSWLPFYDRLWFPYRVTGVAMVPMTFLVVEAWRRWGSRTWVAALILAAGLAGQHRVWPFPDHPTRPPAALDVIDDKVVFTPMRIQHTGLAWQTFFRRPTMGGMGESAPAFWPKGYRARLKGSFAKALDRASRGQPLGYHPKDREAFAFRWLVLRKDLVAERGDDPDEAVAATTSVVGTTPVSGDEQVDVWDLLKQPAP